MKKLILALLAIAAPAAPVQANPIQEHNQLWRALNNAGVTVKVNSYKCEESNRGGAFYNSFQQLIVICQDDGLYNGSQVQAPWTQNDFDSLRHEAVHVIQDCQKQLADGLLDPIFTDDELKELLEAQGWTKQKVMRAMKPYVERGASFDVIRIEMEAWVVAEVNAPDLMVDIIQETCPVNPIF